MFNDEENGEGNKRRRIRIDDDDDEVGSNPDELMEREQTEAESDEDGEDLLDTWKE